MKFAIWGFYLHIIIKYIYPFSVKHTVKKYLVNGGIDNMGLKNQIAYDIDAMLESFEKENCRHQDCYCICYPIRNLKDKESIMSCMDFHSFLDMWES